MRQLAQDMLKALGERLRDKAERVAGMAETMGLPTQVTAMLRRAAGVPEPQWDPEPSSQTWTPDDRASSSPRVERMVPEPERPAPVSPAAEVPPALPVEAAVTVAPVAEAEPLVPPTGAPVEDAMAAGPAAPRASDPVEGHPTAEPTPAERKRTGKRRDLKGPRDSSDRVRPLKVDDAIQGSTYLARIIWSLGVADLEGMGPLRPADIARMIMARSPVSLEPPNVARYIRRSKPTYLTVVQNEGSSSFYTLSPEGQALFEEKYLIR